MDDDPPHRPGTRVSIAVVRPVVATVVSRIGVADPVGRSIAIAQTISGIGVAISRIAVTVIA